MIIIFTVKQSKIQSWDLAFKIKKKMESLRNVIRLTPILSQ